MNAKTTCLVLIIAALLAAYFVLYETDAPKPLPLEAAKAAGQPLLAESSLPPGKVKRIRIQRAGETPAVLQRGDSDWEQTAPIRFPMQAFMVDDLQATAASLRYSSSFTPASKKMSLEELGLSPPETSVTFEGEGVTTTTINLGSRTAAGRAYATLGPVSAASTVYVVEDRLHEAMKLKVSQMRKVNLPGPRVGSVRRIAVQRDGVATQLVNQDSRWMLTAPVTGRADRSAAEALVSSIGGVPIERFVEDNPPSLSPFGLDKPQALLTFESIETAAPAPPTTAAPAPPPAATPAAPSADKQPPAADKCVTHKLAIGSPTDLDNSSYYAMWDDVPMVFTLRRGDADRFLKRTDDLRDAAITVVTRADARELTLERPGPAGKMRVILDQGKWVFADPKPGFAIDAVEFEKLLDAIVKTRAVSYVAAKPTPAAPLATIRLAADHAEPEVLVVRAGEKPDQLMVVRGEETTGYLVNRYELAPVLEPALAFRDRNIIDTTADLLTSIKITRPGAFAARYEIVRQPPQALGPPAPGGASDATKKSDKTPGSKADDWNLEGIDKEAFKRLLAAIVPLRAVSWLDQDQATGPDDPTVELKTADGQTHTVTLHLANHTASAAGIDKAFEINPEIQELVNAELRDKSVLKLDIEQISAVKVGDWAVNRDSSGKFKFDGAGVFQEPRGAAIYDALANLSAIRYVDPSRAAGAPEFTVTFTASGKTRALKIWLPKEGDPIAQLGDKTFTIASSVQNTLTTKPVR